MPAKPAQFHMAAPPDSAVAQRVQMALALRGAVAEVTALRPQNGLAGQGRLTCRVAGQGCVVLHDGAAMLELVEDLFPEAPLHPADPALRAQHRELIGKVLAAHDSLATVLAARDPRDLDLAIFRLRDALRPLDDLPAARRAEAPPALSNLSIALAPLLWRLQVIDGAFQARLGAGLLRIRHQVQGLLQHPQIATVLDQAAAARLVARIRDSGAAVANPESWSVWDRAFASAGAENKLLSGGQRTKVPSIGSFDALR